MELQIGYSSLHTLQRRSHASSDTHLEAVWICPFQRDLLSPSKDYGIVYSILGNGVNDRGRPHFTIHSLPRLRYYYSWPWRHQSVPYSFILICISWDATQFLIEITNTIFYNIFFIIIFIIIILVFAFTSSSHSHFTIYLFVVIHYYHFTTSLLHSSPPIYLYQKKYPMKIMT